MARNEKSSIPPREIRLVKNVRVNRWVKKKEEGRDGEPAETKKFLQVSVVQKAGIPTRCCTKCGFSDLDCGC